MYAHQPDFEHKFLVPNAFTREFADVCARHGVRGKFSVMPMPACLGRIDGKLSHVPKKHLTGFLDIVRDRISPGFDITPEILTHLRAFDLKSGRFLHIYEDEWIARATVEQMTEYIALSLRILKNVGLPANGVTSPWATGRHNEKQYAQAIGNAQWLVHRRKVTWYFLHMQADGPGRWPWVTWQDRGSGRRVLTVPGTTGDAFWETQYKSSIRSARAAADRGVDWLLSLNGHKGRIRDLFDAGQPIVLVTHWQSLFSNGRGAGLAGLAELLDRVDAVFGRQVRWNRTSELARVALRRRFAK
jgi:hypothetical protein